MKICIIGKYPPIEGGVSSFNYWLAKALGENGHKVFIVTNAKEASFEYKEEILPKEAKNLEPKNIKVVNTSPLNRRFIPFYPPFIATLAGLAIEVVKKEKIDIIYSNYLLPYGVAAYIVKQATGIPWYLDHAGSDITNLFDEPLLRPVFTDLFKKADLIVGSPQVYDKLVKPGIIAQEKVSPLGKGYYARIINSNFSPQVKPINLSSCFAKFNKNLPVFTFFGKISELKKTFSLVEAASLFPKGKFYLLFVVERGKNLVKLKNLVGKYNLSENTGFLSFQPPWKIPSIITASTCIVAPEAEEQPYLPKNTHISKISLEAMLCARCAIIGDNMAKKGFYSQLKDGVHFMTVNPEDIKDFSKKLYKIVREPSLAYKVGKRARKFLEQKFFPLWQASLEKFVKILCMTILKAQN